MELNTVESFITCIRALFFSEKIVSGSSAGSSFKVVILLDEKDMLFNGSVILQSASI